MRPSRRRARHATPRPSERRHRRAPPSGALVTARTIIFTTLLLAVFVVAFVVTAAFGRSGYFVGYEGDTVAVFQGRPGGVLWFQPTLASTSQLERDDLTPEFQTRIGRNPEFSSRRGRALLDQLALDERAPLQRQRSSCRARRRTQPIDDRSPRHHQHHPP